MSDPVAPAATPQKKRSAFDRTYWMLNNIEAFERLSYFGIRAVVPIYIMQATEPGGLHLTAVHKGWIYMWWAVFQSFLPIVTGGLADRYGYKKTLGFAITANIIGYVMMAFLTSYYGFFAGVLVLATGTAFFKPSLQGSLAQNLTKDNSSLGWGIFYWVVNVGAFAAPFVATLILGQPHSAEGWRNLFLASAGFTSINLFLLFTFKDVASGASKTDGPVVVIMRTLRNILEPRLIAWLAIMSCFWLMMYQLWDLHPNFIEDWIDSEALAKAAPFTSWQEYGDRGLMRVPQQILLNLNAGLIILMILPISWAVRKMRTLEAMLIGMTVATVGVLVAGLTDSGWILLLGILFFSLGEMLTGPKKNEYLGLIAPPGKKAMYLGYVNIPVGVGVGIGSLIAGLVYDNYGEKATLALKHLGAQPQLVARATQSVDRSDALNKVLELAGIKRPDALGLAGKHLGKSAEQTADHLVTALRSDRGQTTNLALQELALHDEFKEQATAALGGKPLDVASIGARIAELPEATGVNRSEAIERVRWLASQDGAEKQTGAIEEQLWQRHGRQPATLTNLAIEFLAQATPLAHDAAAKLTFDDPVSELPKKVGIGRTKSFGALSAALGVSDEALGKAMEKDFGAVTPAHNRPFAYLMGLKHVRFNAVARVNWSRDVELLKALVSSTPKAVEAAKLRAGGEVDWVDLADDRDAVQATLATVDWALASGAAGRVLGMNPWEARFEAASELNRARLTATKTLWDVYLPQYKVWVPFAIIGILATIALGIFGWKARNWSDMNA